MQYTESQVLEETPVITRVKPGDRILATVGTEEKDKNILPWEVEAVYTHMVLASYGSRRRCFSYGDLIIMGLEMQNLIMEEKGK